MANTTKPNSGKPPVNMENDKAGRFNPAIRKRSNSTKPNSGTFPVNMSNDKSARLNPPKRGGK